MVYEDDQVLAFLDHQPINPGHVLVVPRAHAAHLADLKPEMGGHTFRVGMEIAATLRRAAGHQNGSGTPQDRQPAIRCEGIDLFLADGAAAGQEVFHVHLHVIPRFRGDGFGFRFGPESHLLTDRATLEGVASVLRAAREG
jgi:diadenosine tetraphosphate (Ap4A) HIT family hydrolase